MFVTVYGRNKNYGEIKKIAGRPAEQFKELSVTKQTTRPRTEYQGIDKKPFLKKSDPNNRKNSENQRNCRM